MDLESIDAMTDIVTFNSNVSIFNNTRAIDIPDKLNAIGEALKDHTNNHIIAKVNTYVNDELKAKVQNSMDTVNVFLNNADTSLSQIIENVGINIGNYTSTITGYTVEQTNNLLFTGTVLVEYDEFGNISKQTTGNKTTEVLTVNSRDSILTAKETININGASYIKNYVFTYEEDGITVSSIIIN